MPFLRSLHLALLLLLVPALAGCAGDPADPPGPAQGDGCGQGRQGTCGEAELGWITPNAWHVSASTDHLMVWARNLEEQETHVVLQVTGADGGALPEGWSVSFNKPELHLLPAGTKQRNSYPDWDWSLATLTVPDGASDGTYRIELRGAGAVVPADVTLARSPAMVAKEGSAIEAAVVGTHTDDGAHFWSGDFPTTLGRPGAVTGFAWGLIGIAQGETQAVVVPPPFGYGYDNPPGSNYEQFNGEFLTFTVTLESVRPPASR